jgi:alanine dehydrogenase
MHINAFGSDSPGKQELDPGILRRAKIVVDSLEQCKIRGAISEPIAQGLISERDVYAELGEVVNGWKKGRTDDREVTVMDSTGLAALDVITFNRAYERARSQGIGKVLDF